MSVKNTEAEPVWRFGMALAFVVALLMWGTILATAYLLRDYIFPSGLTAHAEAAPVSGDTPFHHHVVQAGSITCGAAFPAMGQLLTQGSQYMVQSRWNQQNPERHAMHALVGMRFDTPEHTGPAVGYMVAAPVSGSCETGMIRITPFEQSCEEILRLFLRGSPMTARLQGLPTYAVADGSEVMTVPIGENCVTVSVGYSTVSSDDVD